MLTLEDTNRLLEALHNCTDDAESPLAILSNDLDTKVLEKNKFKYSARGEGTYVEIGGYAGQPIQVYKCKKDVISYSTLFHMGKNCVKNTPLISIKERLIYHKDHEVPSFFVNLINAGDFCELLKTENIIDYHDKLKKVFLVCNYNAALTKLGYSKKLLNYCNEAKDTTSTLSKLSSLVYSAQHRSAFKKDLLSLIDHNVAEDERFYTLLGSRGFMQKISGYDL